MRRPASRTLPLLALLATLLVATPGAPGASARPAGQTLRSPAIGVSVKGKPFSLVFRQPRGRITLAQDRGIGSGPGGSLGFQTTDGWFHATNATSLRSDRNSISAILATTDPGGRRIALRVGAPHGGVVAVSARVLGETRDVLQTGIGFRATRDERYLGFGERSDQLDRRGTTTEDYVGEGPYQQSDYPIVTNIVPPWSIHNRGDASYFPMPWLLSTRGYGVLLGNSETSYFRLGTDRADTWSVEAASPRLSFRVFAGPRPADLVRRLTRFTGRQPKPTAPWLLGPWFQTGQPNVVPDEQAWADILRKGDAPVSVAETQMRYLPCGAIEGNDDYERKRARRWHAKGFAQLTYVQEKVCSDYSPVYQQGLAADAFLKHPDGSVYNFKAFVGDHNPPSVDIGQIDFSARGAERFYDSILRRIVADSHDGWMEDFGESIPPDAVAANGMTGKRLHNLYPVLYHRAGWRFAKRQRKPIVRFVRSGWTGVQSYAQIVWGGDPTTSWGFDGLRSAVTEGLSMGLSGVGIWGSDVGGYFTLPGAPQLTPELLIRWIQFGSVSGAMRTKGTGQAIPAYARPQIWEPEILPYWRRYAKLRTQLYPYLAAAVRAYRRTGMPMMRQLSLVFPRDRRAAAQDDEFMFGPDLLAAPVLDPSQTKRTLYLPGGRWVNFWDSVTYGEKRGTFTLRRARVLRGGRQITVDAPLTELPLFIRPGALVAMVSPDIDTLAPYGHAKGLVHLRDRRRRMNLLLLPRGTSRRSFGYGEALRSSERGAGWHLRIHGSARRTYSVEASLATLRRPFKPCRVSVDGRPLRGSAWSFDPSTGVLRARVTARDAAVAVLPCR